jgi:hypothetical protein
MTLFRFHTGRMGRWAVLAVVCLLSQGLSAQEKEPAVKPPACVRPDKATDKNKPTDGESGKAIEIKLVTAFIADASLAHGTDHGLISADGTYVVKGQWRPVLNGKELPDQSTKRYRVELLFELPGK